MRTLDAGVSLVVDEQVDVLGGAFVFEQGGTVVWSHRAHHAGDDADHAALAQALRDASAPAGTDQPSKRPAPLGT